MEYFSKSEENLSQKFDNAFLSGLLCSKDMEITTMNETFEIVGLFGSARGSESYWCAINNDKYTDKKIALLHCQWRKESKEAHGASDYRVRSTLTKEFIS